jgi:hypothetical protein
VGHLVRDESGRRGAEGDQDKVERHRRDEARDRAAVQKAPAAQDDDEVDGEDEEGDGDVGQFGA